MLSHALRSRSGQLGLFIEIILYCTKGSCPSLRLEWVNCLFKVYSDRSTPARYLGHRVWLTHWLETSLIKVCSRRLPNLDKQTYTWHTRAATIIFSNSKEHMDCIEVRGWGSIDGCVYILGTLWSRTGSWGLPIIAEGVVKIRLKEEWVEIEWRRERKNRWLINGLVTLIHMNFVAN